MPGYRQWTNGDNLTPADIDGYLMGQTVMRFANAATRAAAISVPVAGMQSYLADTGLIYIYDETSASWVPDKQAIKKAANQQVVSSVANVADTELKVTLTPGQYRVETFLHVTGAAASDITVVWSFSGTKTYSVRSCSGMGTAGTDGAHAVESRHSGNNLETTISYGIEAATTVIREDLFILVTATGLLQLQWTQNSSGSTPTVVSSASRIYVTRFR